MTDSEESQTFLNRILWQNMENRESISCFIHVLGCANIGWMLHNNTVAVLQLCHLKECGRFAWLKNSSSKNSIFTLGILLRNWGKGSEKCSIKCPRYWPVPSISCYLGEAQLGCDPNRLGGVGRGKLSASPKAAPSLQSWWANRINSVGTGEGGVHLQKRQSIETGPLPNKGLGSRCRERESAGAVEPRALSVQFPWALLVGTCLLTLPSLPSSQSLSPVDLVWNSWKSKSSPIWNVKRQHLDKRVLDYLERNKGAFSFSFYLFFFTFYQLGFIKKI